MKLATIDTRLPITQTFEIWFADGITLDEKKQLEDDLCELTLEVAEKFIGFESAQSIQKALDLALGILSLGLVSATSGEVNFQVWIKELKTRGIFDVVEDAVSLIKAIPYQNVCGTFEEISRPDSFNREQLKMFALHKNNRGVWDGYLEVQKTLSSVQSQSISRQFVVWLIEKYLNQSTYRFLLIHQEPGTDPDTMLIDHAVNTILFRHCCKLSLKRVVFLSEKTFSTENAKYLRDSADWIAKARKRYDELVSEIPTELQSALMYHGRDWFQRYFSKGPMTSYDTVSNPFLIRFIDKKID